MEHDAAQQSILVVEDESIIRMMAVDMFEDAGFHVLEASTGEKALDLIKTCHMTGLFTDVQLDQSMDGFYLARLVHDAHPEMPIIVVSGHCVHKSGELPKGARFIAKPYDPSVVTDALREMISAADAKSG